MRLEKIIPADKLSEYESSIKSDEHDEVAEQETHLETEQDSNEQAELDAEMEYLKQIAGM